MNILSYQGYIKESTEPFHKRIEGKISKIQSKLNKLVSSKNRLDVDFSSAKALFSKTLVKKVSIHLLTNLSKTLKMKLSLLK
jgi:hypothetical protein